MSVEVITGLRPTVRAKHKLDDSQRVQVVYRYWRTSEARGRHVGRSQRERPGFRVIDNQLTASAGPSLMALAGVAALDTTQAVLIWTLVGIALLAMRPSGPALTPQVALRWARRGTGRHRATPGSRRVVAGTWWMKEERP